MIEADPTGDADGTIDWTGGGHSAPQPTGQGSGRPTSGSAPGGQPGDGGPSGSGSAAAPGSASGSEPGEAAGSRPGPAPGPHATGAESDAGVTGAAPSAAAAPDGPDDHEPGADRGLDDQDIGATPGNDDGPSRSVEAERDEYLDRLQRLQAEFENYRRRVNREQAEARERGAEALAAELLPVLDGCEAAIQQGADDVEPINAQLTELLTKAGLERDGEPGEPFDPERHEAVMHEPAGEDDGEVSEIVEVLRTGYSWKGRVLRPAMVKVRG